MSSICALLFIFSIGCFLLYRFFTKAPVTPDLELEAIIMAPPPQEPQSGDANVSEHASEFAETLEKLESGEIQTSDYEQSEFADIIDEEEVEEAMKNKTTGLLLFVVAIIWMILDPESFFLFFQ
ncbi:MAG TPA: hypothetical protein QF716_03480 [Candidatus Thalassarchaeaceae archaeon]|nr:hypothetical protein [Candidatus Thalassarchaeaceae archaeon]